MTGGIAYLSSYSVKYTFLGSESLFLCNFFSSSATVTVVLPCRAHRLILLHFAQWSALSLSYSLIYPIIQNWHICHSLQLWLTGTNKQIWHMGCKLSITHLKTSPDVTKWQYVTVGVAFVMDNKSNLAMIVIYINIRYRWTNKRDLKFSTSLQVLLLRLFVEVIKSHLFPWYIWNTSRRCTNWSVGCPSYCARCSPNWQCMCFHFCSFKFQWWMKKEASFLQMQKAPSDCGWQPQVS